MFAAAYSLGLAAALLTAWVLKRTVLAGEAAPLVIELPPYRLPSLRNALLITFDRASVFVRKAGSVILLISVILWALASYPKLPDAQLATLQQESPTTVAQQSLEYSLAGRAGQAIEPLFAPLGFDWKINVAVISSFAAREVLVSTLSIVYGMGEEGAEDQAGLTETLRRQRRADGSPVFTIATSVSLLVFFVLAMQCLPTQAVTRRETGSWTWAIVQFSYMSVLAYGAAFVAYRLCLMAFPV
jgi:ferrous iron transport protein B